MGTLRHKLLYYYYYYYYYLSCTYGLCTFVYRKTNYKLPDCDPHFLFYITDSLSIVRTYRSEPVIVQMKLALLLAKSSH